MSLWETNGQEHWKHTFFVKTIVAEQFAEKTTKHVSSFLNKLLFWSWPQEKMPKTPAKKCGGSPQKTTNTAKTLFWSCPAPKKRLPEKCHIESHVYINSYISINIAYMIIWIIYYIYQLFCPVVVSFCHTNAGASPSSFGINPKKRFSNTNSENNDNSLLRCFQSSPWQKPTCLGFVYCIFRWFRQETCTHMYT